MVCLPCERAYAAKRGEQRLEVVGSHETQGKVQGADYAVQAGADEAINQVGQAHEYRHGDHSSQDGDVQAQADLTGTLETSLIICTSRLARPSETQGCWGL
jgi:hypothetical protein